MPRRFGPSLTALVFLALGAGTAGQTKAGTPPRTPWGHPDLQGRWTNATVTPVERPVEFGAKEYFSEAEAAEYQKGALDRYLATLNMRQEATISGEFVEGIWVEERSLVPTRRTSLIIGPTGRIPALTADARKRVEARAGPRRTDAADDRTLTERCLWFPVGGPPMLPNIAYNSNYEIVQTPTSVGILAEMGSAFRIITLDGRPHVNSNIRHWQGDSRGRWEGDTLVVETTNFNDQVDSPSARTQFGGSRANLRLVERFRRVGSDLLMYQFTAEDASTWVESWTAEVPMRKLDGLLYEFSCHEGNRGLENILKGARAGDGSR
jgi:hypothetical protein